MLPGLNTPGYLGLISGSMFSGKTSKLIELYKQYTLCDIPVVVINHAADDRYSKVDMSTHDGHVIPCIRTEQLTDLKIDPAITEARVILINEGQFFNDIVGWVRTQVDVKGKIVFVCGLDGDYNRQRFGSWLDLIPLSDEIVKLTSLCMVCKRRAGIFSHRLSSNTDQILIGNDQYIPVCRGCYKNTSTKDTRECLGASIVDKREKLAALQRACLELPRTKRSSIKLKCNHLDEQITRECIEYMKKH